MDLDDREKDDEVKILFENPKKRKVAKYLILERSFEKPLETPSPQPQSLHHPMAPVLSLPR